MQKLGVQLYGTCRRRKLKRKPSFIGQSPSDAAPLPSCTLPSTSPLRRSRNVLYLSKFERWYTWAFEKVRGPPRWKSAAFWNGSCSAHWYSVTNRFCCIIPSTVRGRFRHAVCTHEHQALSELKRTLHCLAVWCGLRLTNTSIWNDLTGKSYAIETLKYARKYEACHLEDLRVDGKIILKWILNEVGRAYTALIQGFKFSRVLHCVDRFADRRGVTPTRLEFSPALFC